MCAHARAREYGRDIGLRDGAGAVVTRDVAPNAIVVGSPARPVKPDPGEQAAVQTVIPGIWPERMSR